MGHGEIEDGHIRAVLLGQLDRLAPVTRLRNDFEPFPLQEAPEALAEDRVVIGQQNSITHFALTLRSKFARSIRP